MQEYRIGEPERIFKGYTVPLDKYSKILYLRHLIYKSCLLTHKLGRENTSLVDLIIQNTNVMYVHKTYIMEYLFLRIMHYVRYNNTSKNLIC